MPVVIFETGVMARGAGRVGSASSAWAPLRGEGQGESSAIVCRVEGGLTRSHVTIDAENVAARVPAFQADQVIGLPH